MREINFLQQFRGNFVKKNCIQCGENQQAILLPPYQERAFVKVQMGTESTEVTGT
jgi:hypothetical protein